MPKRNAARGNPRGARDRPADGRRSGSSVLAAIVTDRRERVVLAARSQTPPRPVGQGGHAERGDGSVRGWQLGRRRGKKTPASQSRNRLHPKCVGRRETRHASGGLSARRNTARSPNETWVPVVEVSLAEAGRTHLWSMTCCVRREAWPQAMRERRSRLDLATEQFARPAMGGGTRPRRTGVRGSIRGVESAFEFRRGRKTSCAIRQKAS